MLATPPRNGDKWAKAPQDPSTRATRLTVRRFASSGDADRDDLDYWRQIPVADRILSVWRLSVEQWTEQPAA
jgi:hypothetical protein